MFSIRHCIDTEPKVLNLCFFAEKTCQTLGKNINLSQGFIFGRTNFILNLELALYLNEFSVHSEGENLGMC